MKGGAACQGTSPPEVAREAGTQETISKFINWSLALPDGRMGRLASVPLPVEVHRLAARAAGSRAGVLGHSRPEALAWDLFSRMTEGYSASAQPPSMNPGGSTCAARHGYGAPAAAATGGTPCTDTSCSARLALLPSTSSGQMPWKSRRAPAGAPGAGWLPLTARGAARSEGEEVACSSAPTSASPTARLGTHSARQCQL